MKIKSKQVLKTGILVMLAIILNIMALTIPKFEVKGQLSIQYTMQTDKVDTYQMFYSADGSWSENNSSKQIYSTPYKEQVLTYNIPKDTKVVRLDLGEIPGETHLSHIKIRYLWKAQSIETLILEQNNLMQDIESIDQTGNQITIVKNGNDAHIILNLEKLQVENWFSIDFYMESIFKGLICLGMNILLYLFVRKRKTIYELLNEVIRNKSLIWTLAKNDFKTKYAGSYLGITWAFVQPIITVLIYWFVFQVGFRSAPIEDFPFVLWLVSGIVPWFFFSEALNNATNSMLEYNYLVKKVVFKISILPIVKIMSSLFVHLFFVAFAIILFTLYGYPPTIYLVQTIYYSFSMFILVLGISYATSAIIIFFKDLGQVINIVLQIGMWMTPIMWSYSMMPQKYQWILKINPMYYIVEGYRDTFINHVWFWTRFNQTIYFWIVAIGCFGLGSLIFKRLKVHFADVL